MADNAKRDENRITTLIAVSTIDPNEVVRIKVNPATGAILAETA